MKGKLHFFSAILSTLCIGIFFVSSILVELFGSQEVIANVKHLIFCPGLFILVPAIAITGGTGFTLSKKRKGIIVSNKKRRMPFIGANGILILIPSAIFLDQLTASGTFGIKFYLVQGLELLAGAVNLYLMSSNVRDGLKMTGKLRSTNYLIGSSELFNYGNIKR